MLRKASFLLVSSISFVIACGQGDPALDKTEVEGRVNAALAPTKAALDHPTGLVDANSAPRILKGGKDTSASTGTIPGAPVGTRSTGIAPRALGTLGLGLYGGPCYTSDNENSGTIDVSCATKGESTGSMRVYSAEEGDRQLASIEIREVCEKKTGDCITGTMSFETSGKNPVTAVWAIDVTETKKGGASEHVKAGFRSVTSDEASRFDFVVYGDDGQTYVMRIATDQASTSIELVGRNGSYRCDFQNDGTKGSCTGPEGSFAW